MTTAERRASLANSSTDCAALTGVVFHLLGLGGLFHPLAGRGFVRFGGVLTKGGEEGAGQGEQGEGESAHGAG